MAEFGLTLPEHDLTAPEFKELARRLGRAAFTPLFLKLYERVISSEATIEEQRKVLADIGRWTGVEEDKKADPNANLPVFNIVFGAPAAGRASIEVVDVTPPPEPAPAEPPQLADADLPVFTGSLVDNAAFRELAQKVMTPPEPSHAEPQAAPPADEARADAAEVIRALDAADASLEPAGPSAPAAASVLPEPKRGRPRLRAVAAGAEALPVRAAPVAQASAGAVPEAAKRLTAGEHGVLRAAVADSAEIVAPGRLEDIARSHDSLEESLKGLDSILGI